MPVLGWSTSLVQAAGRLPILIKRSTQKEESTQKQEWQCNPAHHATAGVVLWVRTTGIESPNRYTPLSPPHPSCHAVQQAHTPMDALACCIPGVTCPVPHVLTPCVTQWVTPCASPHTCDTPAASHGPCDTPQDVTCRLCWRLLGRRSTPNTRHPLLLLLLQLLQSFLLVAECPKDEQGLGGGINPCALTR